jgi:aldose 1-epimerase
MTLVIDGTSGSRPAPPRAPVASADVNPTGAQIELAAGEYAATIAEVGATLRTLTHRGRPLVAGFGVHEPAPDFHGAVLAPWPNRIADGRYSFDGESHQLSVSEPARNTALHGLVAWTPWTTHRTGAAAAELRTVLYPQLGYPFLLSLTARYELDGEGLRLVVSARNDGDRPAPYGVSIHPWFVAGDGPIAEWTLTVPAASALTTDARLLPVGREPVRGELDFRTGRAIGATRLDHTFIDLVGDATATLRGPDGRGVAITGGQECRWLQVCTGDEAVPRLNRRAVAIEPMTCAPDAFRSGEGLVRLEPGQTHEASWRVAALG